MSSHEGSTAFFLSACHVLRLSYPPSFDHLSNRWQGAHVIEPLVTQFSLPSCYFLLLKPK
jgi:hypothetical protein